MLLAEACGSSGKGSSATTNPPTGSNANVVTGTASTNPNRTVAGRPVRELQYGVAPHPTGEVVFQPDVVLVGGGPDMVRSVNATGTDWTIDAAAPNADHLAVGKIMYLTSKAVGRIGQIQKGQGTLTVSLHSVTLREMFKRLSGKISRKVTPAEVANILLPNRFRLTRPASLAGNSDAPVTTTTTPVSGGATTSVPSRVVNDPPATTPSVPPTDPDLTNSPIFTVPTEGGGSSNGGGASTCPEPSRAGTAGDFSDPSQLQDPLFKPQGLDAGIDGPRGELTLPDASSLPPPKHIPLPGEPQEQPDPEESDRPVETEEYDNGTKVSMYQRGGFYDLTEIVNLKNDNGLTVQVGACLGISADATVDEEISITEQRVAGLVAISGLDEFVTWVDGGSANGIADNSRYRLKMPVAVEYPFGTMKGIPLTGYVSAAAVVDTAFSAKNSTLSGFGVYRLHGPMYFTWIQRGGESGGHAGPTASPTLTIEKPMLDSLEGRSVGANGVVWAFGYTFGIGFGPDYESADEHSGVFEKLVFGMGVTVGSDLGIVKCRGATVGGSFQGGITASLAQAVSPPQSTTTDPANPPPAQPPSILVDTDFFQRTATRPKVPVCEG
jgi:hypothetical protein